MRQVLKVGRRVWGVARSLEISEKTLGNWCGRVRTFSDRAPVRAARGLAQRLLCVVAPRSRHTLPVAPNQLEREQQHTQPVGTASSPPPPALPAHAAPQARGGG